MRYPEMLAHTYDTHPPRPQTVLAKLLRTGSEEAVQIYEYSTFVYDGMHVMCILYWQHRRWLGNQEIIRVASVCSLCSIVYTGRRQRRRLCGKHSVSNMLRIKRRLFFSFPFSSHFFKCPFFPVFQTYFRIQFLSKSPHSITIAHIQYVDGWMDEAQLRQNSDQTYCFVVSKKATISMLNADGCELLPVTFLCRCSYVMRWLRSAFIWRFPHLQHYKWANRRPNTNPKLIWST